MGNYLRPTDVSEALAALDAAPRMIIAGGTDYYPARVGRPLDDDILDVTAIEGLNGITDDGAGWRIGALATWTDLIRADLPPLFDGLKRAAREVGGAQVQNAATIVGNVCNASPAADGAPNLLALDASVEIASADGRRTLPLANFILGNRRTALDDNEMVTGIVVPGVARPARATFLKLGARKYLVISIVMVSAVLEITPDGAVAAARVAVGACSEVACRLPALEAALVGQPVSAALADVVADAHLAPLSPIGDIRGSAAYRLDAAATLVRRALAELGT